jgi:hypothetical protein
MKPNRGKVNTTTIAEKLKKAEAEIFETIKPKHQYSTKNTTPIVFLEGRLNRKENKYLSKNLTILEKLNNEIKIYCKGIDLVVLNYILHKGIESIKKDKNFSVINFKDIESLYK